MNRRAKKFESENEQLQQTLDHSRRKRREIWTECQHLQDKLDSVELPSIFYNPVVSVTSERAAPRLVDMNRPPNTTRPRLFADSYQQPSRPQLRRSASATATATRPTSSTFLSPPFPTANPLLAIIHYFLSQDFNREKFELILFLTHNSV